MLKPQKLVSETEFFVSGKAGEGHTAPSDQDHERAWSQVCRRLRAEVGEDVFNSWFGRLELDDVSGGTARLSVPTKFLKSWITSHYTDRIVAVLGSEIPGVTAATVSVRTSSRPPSPVRVQRSDLAPAGDRPAQRSQVSQTE